VGIVEGEGEGERAPEGSLAQWIGRRCPCLLAFLRLDARDVRSGQKKKGRWQVPHNSEPSASASAQGHLCSQTRPDAPQATAHACGLPAFGCCGVCCCCGVAFICAALYMWPGCPMGKMGGVIMGFINAPGIIPGIMPMLNGCIIG